MPHLRTVAMRDHHLAPTLNQGNDPYQSPIEIGHLLRNGSPLSRPHQGIPTQGDKNPFSHVFLPSPGYPSTPPASPAVQFLQTHR